MTLPKRGAETLSRSANHTIALLGSDSELHEFTIELLARWATVANKLGGEADGLSFNPNLELFRTIELRFTSEELQKAVGHLISVVGNEEEILAWRSSYERALVEEIYDAFESTSGLPKTRIGFALS